MRQNQIHAGHERHPGLRRQNGMIFHLMRGKKAVKLPASKRSGGF